MSQRVKNHRYQMHRQANSHMRIQDNYLNTNVTPLKEGLSNEA